jgi:hypothetical protein
MLQNALPDEVVLRWAGNATETHEHAGEFKGW